MNLEETQDEFVTRVASVLTRPKQKIAYRYDLGFCDPDDCDSFRPSGEFVAAEIGRSARLTRQTQTAYSAALPDDRTARDT